MGEERKVYKVLMGKPEGKKPLGRPRRMWEYGIGMDLREIGFGGVDWIRLAQDRDRWFCCYVQNDSELSTFCSEETLSAAQCAKRLQDICVPC
jgi:hypothetical protein